MKMSDLVFGVMIGCLAIGIFMFIQFVIAGPMRDNAERDQWEQGYCTALTGQWIAAGVCNVDGKVVTIEKEE
jgi:hypothetical protein